MMEQQYHNEVALSGRIVAELTLSHEVYGEKFYTTLIKVKRLSEIYDVIPILLSERLIADKSLPTDVTVKGQFRSYNKVENGKSRLLLTLFVRDLLPFDDSINANTIEIMGYICKPPIFRVTPFMREICDCLIAVNRAYNKSDYIPCIAWGRNARYVKSLPVGEKVLIEGRVQSREYQKQVGESSEMRVAYEVSVSKVLAGDKAKPRSKDYQPIYDTYADFFAGNVEYVAQNLENVNEDVQ